MKFWMIERVLVKVTEKIREVFESTYQGRNQEAQGNYEQNGPILAEKLILKKENPHHADRNSEPNSSDNYWG